MWPPTIRRSTFPANSAYVIETLRLNLVSVALVAEGLNYIADSKIFEDKVKGLAKLLESLDMMEHLGAAEAFCVPLGAKNVADLKRPTLAENLATELNLPKIMADHLVQAIGALPARE